MYAADRPSAEEALLHPWLAEARRAHEQRFWQQQGYEAGSKGSLPSSSGRADSGASRSSSRGGGCCSSNSGSASSMNGGSCNSSSADGGSGSNREAHAAPWLSLGGVSGWLEDSLVQRLQRYGTYGKLKQVQHAAQHSTASHST